MWPKFGGYSVLNRIYASTKMCISAILLYIISVSKLYISCLLKPLLRETHFMLLHLHYEGWNSKSVTHDLLNIFPLLKMCQENGRLIRQMDRCYVSLKFDAHGFYVIVNLDIGLRGKLIIILYCI